MSNDKKEKERRHISAEEAAGAELYFKFPPWAQNAEYADLLRGVDRLANQAMRQIAAENANRIAESGARAAQQANAPVPAWFGPWTKKEEVVNILAEGNLKAYLEIQKREGTWSARFRKGLGWFVGGLVLAIVGGLVLWAMGLIGLK